MKTIVANWKMNGTIDYIDKYFDVFLPRIKSNKAEVIFAVPYVFLEHVKKITKNSNIKIFAQNCSHEENGAFTGEISASMLSSMGIDGSIIGHCEREKYGENCEIVNKKAKSLFKYKLKPIICIGEESENQLEEQIKKRLYEIDHKEHIFLAYEPIWSVGKNNNLNLGRIESFIKNIRNVIFKYDFRNIKVLYGGSVSKSNTSEILQNLNIDGVLVGRDSLDPINFSRIVNFLE